MRTPLTCSLLLACAPLLAQQQPAPTPMLTGRIVDVLGDPVPAASIEIVAGDRVVRRVATDGEGVYRVPDAPADRSELRISAAGKVPLTLPWRGASTQRVRNATLRDATTLTGTVVDDRGGPAAGAVIRVSDRVQTAQAITDGDGRFVLSTVPLQRVQLRAWGADGTTTLRTLRMRGDTRLELRLTRTAANVRSVQVAGLPAAAIATGQVQVFGPSMAQLPDRGRSPLRADGSAELLLDEPSLVVASSPGYVCQPGAVAAHGAGPRLVFECSPAAGRVGAVTLQGKLRTTTKADVAGVRIVVRDGGGRDVGQVDVDRRGGFRVEVNPTAGSLYCLGVALDAWVLDDDQRRFDDGFSWVPVNASGDPLELWVQPTKRLESPVLCDDGTLLAFATVTVADPDAPHRALVETCCDQDGDCCLSLPEGQYDVLATDHAGRVCRSLVVVQPGAGPPTAFWSTVGTGHVEGTLRDADGQPLPGTTLLFAHTDAQNENLVSASARQMVRVLTDRDGRFRCRGLPAGDWTAVALDEPDVPPAALRVVADRTEALALVRR